MTPDQERRFSKDLLAWYATAKRSLPWRRTRAPYRILVSEVLLQQTRVDTAEAYYRRFVQRFPRLQDLAEAPLESVLQVWQGLGYYGRARNLHRAAQTIRDRFQGHIPSDPETLGKLPGVGPYTAAAVASIAFQRDVFTIDGNVKRVLSRIYAIRTSPELPEVRKRMEKIGLRLLPRGKAGDFNQALMELGALVCKPGRPDCDLCPVKRSCKAREKGLTERLPVRIPRGRVPVRRRVVGAIRSRGRLFFVRRPPEGLLGGLWELPGCNLEDGENTEQGLGRLCASLEQEVVLRPPQLAESDLSVRHTYSHFQELLFVFLLAGIRRAPEGPRDRHEPLARWYHPRSMGERPVTGATRKILEEIAGRSPPRRVRR